MHENASEDIVCKKNGHFIIVTSYDCDGVSNH